MNEKIVTVFGGSGFLGSEIVRALAAAGYRVRAASRHPDKPGFEELEGRVDRLAVDICDDRAVADALRGAHGAVNAVSLYVEKGGLTFERIHVQGAAGLARAAQDSGVARLVHISGIGADTAARSKYVRARARGEQAVREAFPEVTLLRPSVLFGPGGGFLAPLELATRFPVVPLFGRGDTRLQPVHVGDVAAAVREALARPETAGRTYELGGGEIYRYREIVKLVCEHLGRRRRLLPFPFSLWKILATLLSPLPNPPFNRDQVLLMEADNVVADGVESFTELDIAPASLDSRLAESLARRR